MSQAAATPAAAFPEIDLDASAPPSGQTYHKLVLTSAVKQDGQPWTDQVTTFHHASNANVSIIVGNIANLGSKLGPKGTKAKGQNFDLEITLTSDGQNVLNPSPAAWNDVGREFILAAERAQNEMWASMNEENAKVAKAHGKI